MPLLSKRLSKNEISTLRSQNNRSWRACWNYVFIWTNKYWFNTVLNLSVILGSHFSWGCAETFFFNIRFRAHDSIPSWYFQPSCYNGLLKGGAETDLHLFCLYFGKHKTKGAMAKHKSRRNPEQKHNLRVEWWRSNWNRNYLWWWRNSKHINIVVHWSLASCESWL